MAFAVICSRTSEKRMIVIVTDGGGSGNFCCSRVEVQLGTSSRGVAANAVVGRISRDTYRSSRDTTH